MTKLTKPKRKATTTMIGPLPGISLEKAVARIQQLLDPTSAISHNERLVDRIGNTRQCDVVIRGQFGGHEVLGVMECKDHNRKKGPDSVEAFAKKTEHLGANLRLIVSRKGFTNQALKLAKHEHIGCLSLIPDNPELSGFSIGSMWYGIINKWLNVCLTIQFAAPISPIVDLPIDSVKWDGKPVINWFRRELITKMLDRTGDGRVEFGLVFDQPRDLQILGKDYTVLGLACTANGVYAKKRLWVSVTGDAFYDWHSQKLLMPANSPMVGSPVPTDLAIWPDYDGEVPRHDEPVPENGFRVIMQDVSRWDDSIPVPDLIVL